MWLCCKINSWSNGLLRVKLLHIVLFKSIGELFNKLIVLWLLYLILSRLILLTLLYLLRIYVLLIVWHLLLRLVRHWLLLIHELRLLLCGFVFISLLFEKCHHKISCSSHCNSILITECFDSAFSLGLSRNYSLLNSGMARNMLQSRLLNVIRRFSN